MRLPRGWFVAGSNPEDYVCRIDSKIFHSGTKSAHLKDVNSSPKGFVTLMQNFFPIKFLGERVRLSAFIKTENVKNWTGLWLRIDGLGDKILSFDNMENRKLVGTKDWGKYEIILDVPKECINLAFGIILSGEGQVWMDDLQFDRVSKDIPTTELEQKQTDNPQNLDFEG